MAALEKERHGPQVIACAVLVLCTCAVLPGCVGLGHLWHCQDGPPHGAVHQAVATWNNEVVVARDPLNGGVATPGLAGRLYLFGPQLDHPLDGDGTVVIDLYDESTCDTNTPPVHLEQWRLDQATLKRLQRRDVIGWGYTLFLPWGTFRPEITRVRLKVCYQPMKGTPLYAEGGAITLDNAAPPQAVASRKPAAKVTQAAAQVPVAQQGPR